MKKWMAAMIAGQVAMVLAADSAAPAAQTVSDGAASGTLVLTDASPWCYHMTFRKPIVQEEIPRNAVEVTAQPRTLNVMKLHGGRGTPDIQHLESAPPPTGWAMHDFNDSDWPRVRGPFHEPNVSVGTLCLRGRFHVSDPASVERLQFEMTFRGGAIIYLNGAEVARAYLPPGPVALTDPAIPYPAEAWVSAGGGMLPIPRQAQGDDVTRIATRDRMLAPVKIAATGLRKGVNVLAIELHRSDFHPVAIGWWGSANLVQGITKQWTPAGLSRVALKAGGSGFEPNLDRPKGIRVWTADINTRISDVAYGDPQEHVRPIVIRGARNGVYSGQTVISSDAPIRQVQARVSALALGGKGPVLNPTAAQVRYVLEGSVGAEQISSGGAQAVLFNALAGEAPDEVRPVVRPMYRPYPVGTGGGARPPSAAAVAVLPVLVTVRVPRDAAPGEYQGNLVLSAGGLPEATVPIRLHVADWTVPSPWDFRTHVGLFQSPSTLAMRYHVPEWSEEHWKLMEKSFQMLGEVGNDLVNIPISEQTQFGNDEGIVRFVRRADGTLIPDFTVFDRYLKLVRKYLGKPPFIAMHVWHPGTWVGRKADEPNTVTVIDPTTGKRIESWQVPVFGTEASRNFWQPVLAAVKARLSAEGLEQSMCLGILCDATAPQEVLAMFDEIAPGTGWTRGCHSVTFAREPYGLKGGGKCVYHEFCYGLSIADPLKQFPAIHDMPGPGVAWFRGEYDYRLPPFIYRTITERGLYCRTRGVGRMGLDFWDVILDRGDGKKRSYCIFNRWPNSSVGGHGDPTLSGLADAGPEGARPSLRFELFREGLQEAEAAITLSAAMAEAPDRIGPELTARCKSLLVERINVCRGTQGISEDFYAGWQDRSERLYAAAAEVAAKRGAK